GAVVAAVGLAILLAVPGQWGVLGNICALAGALLFGGGIVKAYEGSVASFAIVAAVFAASGIVARSGLLIGIAVLALSSCLGVRTGYLHAMYFLGIQEPTLTIAVFSALAF